MTEAKENFADDHFDNILRLFDVLPNFPFTTSQTMRELLLINMAYASCLTSCRTTEELGS